MGTSREDLDRLLENTRWVRALGIELLGAGEADDLVQETWLVALERPGRALNPPAWLAGVMRRLAGRRRRGAERRARRERAVARPEAQPPTDDLVAEAEIQRELIRAVTELDEPLRSTVLLRFFRGWTSEEIAQSEGVAGVTVRTRLHRALAKLRERLDREHGSREGWALAFVSPAGLAPVGTITGGAWMGTKALIVGAALIAVAGYWFTRVGDDAQGELARAEERVASTVAAPAGDGQTSETPGGAARGAGARRVLDATLLAAPAVREVLLYGSVTDAGGRPVELGSFSLESAEGAYRNTEQPSAGSYSISGLAPGRYTSRVKAQGFVAQRADLVLRDDEPHQRHDLVLQEALSIPVRIVDENGKSLARWGRDPNYLSLDVVATRDVPAGGLCGLRGEGSLFGCGEFASLSEETVPGLPAACAGLLRLSVKTPVHVSVILQDAVLATQRVDGPMAELVFTLERARLERQLGGVRVRFVDALSGQPIPGGRAALDPPNRYSMGDGGLVDGPAEFELAGRAPGLHTLHFFHPDYEGFARCVRVPVGRVEDFGDVLLVPRATIRGTVFDARGKPITASLACAPRFALPGPGDTPRSSVGTFHGAFELNTAARGPVQLVVQAPQHALFSRTIDASSGLVEGLVLQLEEGVPVVLRCAGNALGSQLTIADEGGVPLMTWTTGDYAIKTRLAAGRYQLWTGLAERVDGIQELVVGGEPVTRTISFE